ncbi:MAG: KOW domain-containing RNA-binding protein [Lachnospiraceae bacterium]|nr:KOW domain-containing RNA-binding protein [Lachnospiraceae bacterium]
MNGRIAVSKAGHDAGKAYVIVGCDREFLLLADGIGRKLGNPKRKNLRHVEVCENEEASKLKQMISEKARGCDEAIRQVLHHL